MAIIDEHREETGVKVTPEGHSMLRYITEIRVFAIFAILTFGVAQAFVFFGSRFESLASDPLVVMIAGSVVGAVAVVVVKRFRLIR